MPDWFNLGGLGALLTAVGGGIAYFFTRSSTRESQLLAREKEHRLGMEARIDRLETSYGVLAGVVHALLDAIDPTKIDLDELAAHLLSAYPSPQTMPSEIMAVIARIKVISAGHKTEAS